MDEDTLVKRKNKAQRENNLKVLADVQKKLGDLYYDKKQYDDALKAYKGQLQACECLNNKLHSAIAHRMIGEVYADIGKFNEALDHQNLYLEIAKELKDLTEEQRAFATLGRTYLLVADSFIKESERSKKMEVLRDAKKAFSKSIKLCDMLENKIDLTELMMMRARLLLNLGLVLEQQRDTEQALNLINQAAGLCRKHCLREDMHRTNIALAGLNERLGNSELALKKLDDAAKVDDIYLKADARLLKAELLLKLGEWMEAQKLLRVMYKSKNLLEPIRQQVAKLLKIAVVLCKTEDNLLTEFSPVVKEKLYERMGDAATSVKSLDKAVEYYRCMLSCAEESNSSQLGAALTSLTQTLRDAGKLQEAIPYARRELELCKDPKEACNSALYLAGLLAEANSPSSEVKRMFEQALSHSKKDPGLERTVLREFVEYLEKMEDVDLEEIARLNDEMERLPKVEDDDDDEDVEENTPDIGADVCLEELSDLEEEVPAAAIPAKNVARNISRRARFTIKRNDKGETQLHVACIKGNIGAVEKLLEEHHPTAVRDNCGWTPLHEASNHGFVDIVRVLVRHGADVNDPGGANCDGVTALHDAAANGHVAVIQLLLDSGADANLLIRTGESALDCLEQWRQRVGDLTPVELKEYVLAKRRLQATTTVTGKKKKNREPENRRWNALVDEDGEDEVRERGKTMEDYARPEKISAGEDYKRTIAALQHPGRQQLKAPTKKLSRITAPLLDSEDMLVDEDWLEDDLGIASSRQKDKAPTYFATNGVPPPPTNETTAGSAKRKSKNDNDEDDAIFEEDKSMKRQRISIEKELAKKAPVIVDEDSCDSDKAIENWPKKKKKPRQMNLLKQGFTRNVCSRSPSPTHSISPEPIFESAIQQERHSWDSSSISETINLDIDVDGEAFELKLHYRDLRKSMSDIGELIKHKFEARTGCRPKIRFKVDGIALADEVTLEEVPREKNNLRLCGEIAQNDLLPIVDRYKKVCETFGTECTDSMFKSLRSCDNTLSFRLNRLDADKPLEPLLRCLRYQLNLRTLNLSGATLFSTGDLLNRAIAQLSGLDELHLQCCDIDFNCLSCIEALPLSIRVLDLSYNPLTGCCQKKLYELLKPLERLQTLSLRYCELDDFRFVVTSGSLVNLDVSWNPIGGQGIANLLQRQLLTLNISNTQNASGGRVNVIDKIFFSDSTISFYTLESLELSSCQATDLDIEKILSQSPNLTKITLSNNINVTKTSLCAILRRNPTMTYVNLTGCRLVDQPPEPNLKIVSPQVCTLFVHMTLNVIDVWENLWQRKGHSKKLPHSLVLFKPI